MAILPQSPRDQRLLIVAILALGLAGVYEQLVWAPKNTELDTLQTRVHNLDSLNHLTDVEVKKGNADQMKREAVAYTRELEVLQGLVPTANEVPGLLESISSAARRAGLEISDFAPDGPPVRGDQYDTYRYKLGVTGPYHRIGEFLSNIATLPRIVEPINLTLSPTARGGEKKPIKGESLLDAHFQVQTFVSHATANKSTPTTKAGMP